MSQSYYLFIYVSELLFIVHLRYIVVSRENNRKKILFNMNLSFIKTFSFSILGISFLLPSSPHLDLLAPIYLIIEIDLRETRDKNVFYVTYFN